MTNIKEQEINLWRDYRAGNKSALPTLINSLDPVIQSNVNKFAAVPLPRSALESEARRLVVNSFETYDPSKSALNTHVTNHLKHLQRYVLQYQNVGKIPEHRGIAISRFQNLQENLTQEKNRPSTVVELADALSWSPQEVLRMQEELRSDLTIGTGKEDSSSFFDSAYNSQNVTNEVLHFIYFSADPLKKKVMEYTWPTFGKQVLSTSGVANKLNISESAVRKINSEIATDIRKYEIYF